MTKEQFLCRLVADESKHSVHRQARGCYKTFADLDGCAQEGQLRQAQDLGILNVRRYAAPGERKAYLRPGDRLTPRELAVLAVCYLDSESIVASLRRRHFSWSTVPLTTFEKGALVFALANGLLDEEQLKRPGEPLDDDRTEASLARLFLLRQKPERLVVPSAEPDTLWVGTMPFSHEIMNNRECRLTGMRPDWLTLLTKAENWGPLLEQTDVYKMYLNILPGVVYEGEKDLRLEDEELQRLAGFLREHHLLSAFDLGGVRLMPEVPLERLGREYACHELELALRRWHRCGGEIDCICVSNAIFTTFQDILDQPEAQQYSYAELYDILVYDLVDYLEVMTTEYPDAAFGCLESMGYYELDPKRYPSYFQEVFPLSFEEHLDRLLKRLSQHGIVLDQFHFDCQLEDIEEDTMRNYGSLIDSQGDRIYDLGKIELARDLCESRGLRCGYVFNSGGEGFKLDSSSDARVCTKMLNFYRYCAAHGLRMDFLEMQSWNYFPTCAGPAERTYSEFWLYNEFLRIAGKQALNGRSVRHGAV